MATDQATLALAWHYYQSGDPSRAEQVYRQVLRDDPAHADVWCLLGIVYRAQGKLNDAAASQREALRLRPGFLEALNNLGNVLVTQEKLAEAEAAFREVLRLRPDYTQAYNNLGVALRNQGKLEEAAGCYRRALQLMPNYAEAHNNLGDALKALGQLEDAVACYHQALRLKSNYPEAHNNLGAALNRLGRPEEAVAQHHQALALRPGFADAYLNLGNALMTLKKLDEAAAAYTEALRLKPDSADGYSNLGTALAEKGKLDEAVAAYEAALKLAPDYAEARANLGNAFQEQGKIEAALACYEKALLLKPDYAEAHDNRSQALLAQGKVEDAVAGFGTAINIRPDYAEARMGRALAWLAKGDYERGWAEYEWRWRTKGFARPDCPAPHWDGSPLEGRTILLYAEQGLGDTLQFIRYALLVKQRGGRVVVQVQKPLMRLLAGCPGIDALAAQGDAVPPCDVQAPLLGLPRIFGTTLDTVPARVPYLFPDPALVERWRHELAGVRGLRVGIAWQGNPAFPGDRHRSYPLAALAPLARVEGVHLIGLQKEHGRDQLQALNGAFELHDLGPQLDLESGPFRDTAAVMTLLDLVVTPNSSLAHLAGALGVPVWIALPSVPEWRWLLDREDSPWYPTARLFRQQQMGDWPGVFERMAGALRDVPRRRRAGPLLVEVSPGELLDRIASSQARSERFADPAVASQLRALEEMRDQSLEASPELSRLTAELRTAVEALWQAEKGLRDSAQQKEYGSRFTELTRAHWTAEEQRQGLRRRIDELCGVTARTD